MKRKNLLLKPLYYVEPGSDQERKVMKSAISLAGFVVFFDLISKVAIVEMLKNPGTRIPVIPGIFDITYITNKGAAWGMFSGKSALLLTVSVVVFVLITFFLKQICEGWTERYYALLLVMAAVYSYYMLVVVKRAENERKQREAVEEEERKIAEETIHLRGGKEHRKRR